MYSIDTSALLTWWIRRYPQEVFPGIVPRMARLVKEGRLRASEYVLQELGAKKDPLFDWAKAQAGLFMSTDMLVQQRAAHLTAKYPNLIDPTSKKPVQADPFIIALAAEHQLTVMTAETYAKTKTTGQRKQRTYIPDVCAAEGVACIDFLDLMRREKWSF